MDVPEALISYPAPAPQPRARTLWIILSLLLLVVGLALAAGAAALLGLADPLFGSGSAADDAHRAPVLAEPPPPPEIAPVEFLDVSPATAKEMNDAVPFTTEPVPAAAPVSLLFKTVEDQQRAADCLAAAAWYEAGNDPIGQSAVVQVVLNRLRHAAFPKTVCGVVFQGSERRTGCQFSFTCDGSMIRRKPPRPVWKAAQGIALTAVRGVVFPRVGWATHYHTDWVVPNWSSSVDKVAAVGTHLFFRWRGENGRPHAFQGRYAGEEPLISAMAGLSPAHGKPDAGTEAEPLAVDASVAPAAAEPGEAVEVPGVNMRGSALARADAADNLYVIRLEPGQLSGATALVGLELCAKVRTACTVAGFVGTPGRAVSRGLGRVEFPDRQPDFYYFVDRSRSRERVLWNCRLTSRPDDSQCLPDDFKAEG